MIRNVAVVGAVVVAALLSWRDLSFHTNQDETTNVNEKNHNAGSDVEKPVAEPKLKNHYTGPTLRFLYCYSWGYKRVFEEFSNLVRQRYPAVMLEGDHYPPTAFKALSAQVLSFTKMGLLLLIVVGYNPFNMIGVGTPSIYNWALQNKIYACMMLFFIGNAIEGQLISTGAFEVYLNDVPVWSKLEVGRIPSPQELFQILDSQFRLTSSSPSSHSSSNTL